MISRTLMTGLLAGLAAGIVLTLLYVGKIQPLILAAEGFESGSGQAGPATMARLFDTFLFNLITGVGFGLLLAAAFVLRGQPVGARDGLLWGVAGFAVFVLAPSAGLPPELPGTMKPPVEDRQLWWLFTVAATAAGTGLIAFQARRAVKAAGVALLLLPHIVGAPHAEDHAGLLPAELAASYVGVTLGAMALFWLVLGGVAGWCHDRFGREAPG